MDYDDRAKKHPPEDLIERVRKIIETREKKGITKHVLVFHELKISAEALKVLIPELLGKGYKFVTLEDYFSEAGK
jgi:peptidoglycan/xylan/chitin deacetylase (PgdA/CDA1 family)